MKYSLKTVKDALKKHNMIVSKNDGEYRVNFITNREETAYYTNDIEDALLTGVSMATLRDELLSKNEIH